MDRPQVSFAIRISLLISNFFHPIISLLIYFIHYSTVHYSWRETLAVFLPILLITVVPVTLWIFYNVKKKRYTNMDVSDRNERKSLYFFVAGSLLLYVLFNFYYLDSSNKCNG